MKKNARDTLATIEPVQPVDVPTLCVAAEIPVETALARKSVQAGPFSLPLRREYLAQLSASRVRVLGKYTHPGNAPAGAPRLQLDAPTEDALTAALERLAMQQALEDAQADKLTRDWRKVTAEDLLKGRTRNDPFFDVTPPPVLAMPGALDAATVQHVQEAFDTARDVVHAVRRCAVRYAIAQSGEADETRQLQAERLKAGYMNAEQQAQLVRQYLFAPYAAFQRAERIPRLAELAHDGGVKPNEVAVVDVGVTSLSDKAYAQLKALAVVPHPEAIATDDPLPPRVDVDPLLRRAFPKPPNGAPPGSYGQKPLTERLIARVTVTWHGWAVHRDYSLE